MSSDNSADTSQADSETTSVEPKDDLEDGHQALAYTATWINNADTKAGLLSAAVAVVLAGITQQAHSIKNVLSPAGGGEWAALSLFALLAGALMVAIIALAKVITPRMPLPQSPSRFGFPTLASPTWRHHPATREGAAEEVWQQARLLSSIARSKFGSLRVASIATFSSLPLFGAWSVVASVIDG